MNVSIASKEEIVVYKAPEEYLVSYEKEELAKWRRRNEPPLSQMTAIQFYQLFLIGHSCEEIVKANENRFPLGMVLDARVRYEWDKRREIYLEKLYKEAEENVKQRQHESAVFITDLMAVTHKLYGQRAKSYLQTGDPKALKDLQDYELGSLAKYRIAVDILSKVTGQDRAPRKADAPLVQINAANVNNEKPEEEKPQLPADTSPFDILQMLQRVDEERLKEKAPIKEVKK